MTYTSPSQLSPRSALIGKSLLGLLVSICSLPAGQAMAVTFSRDPAADGWNKVGNSKTQGTANFGGWAANSTAADFDIYSTSFLLSAADTVSAPATGAARGDDYLYSSTLDGTATNKWNVGDKIVGLGVKFINGQVGSAANGRAIFLNFEPNPQVGTAFVAGTLSTTTDGQWDFFAGGNQNGASAGSINFNVVTSRTVQNQGPFGDTYSVKTAPGGSTTNNTPYGSIAGNGNNISTSGSSPLGTAPMRVFGNYIDIPNTTNDTWTSYQIFLNESLMTRNGKGEAAFTSNALWSVSASNSQMGQWDLTTATGPMRLGGSGPSPSSQVPGPLPLLGAGAAFGWSRRLRRQITARHGGSKITA
jgi:hypothetical protein